jgi:hypothetical protein
MVRRPKPNEGRPHATVPTTTHFRLSVSDQSTDGGILA